MAPMLILASCGRSAKPSAGQPGGAPLHSGDQATVAPAGGGRTPTTAKASGPTVTTARGGTQTRGTSPSTTAAVGSRQNEDVVGKGAVGSFARSILQPQPYQSIRFEMLEQSDAEPSADVVSHATGILHTVSEKSVNVTTVSIPGGAQEWSPGMLHLQVEKYGTANAGSGEAVMHILFVHGELSGSPNVLGVATRGDVLTIFVDRIDDSASLTVSARSLEKTTLTHEMGHMLGLVDEVLNDHRSDPNDPSKCLCHSQSKKSVMYWAVDTTDVLQLFQGGPPSDFDGDDNADLARIQSGA